MLFQTLRLMVGSASGRITNKMKFRMKVDMDILSIIVALFWLRKFMSMFLDIVQPETVRKDDIYRNNDDVSDV